MKVTLKGSLLLFLVWCVGCCVSECVVKSNGRKHCLDCCSPVYFEAL